MCFRPPDIAAKVVCPECGTENGAMAKTCFKCGADLPEQDMSAASAGSIGIPVAPSAPGIPATPGMPSAPAAFSAPKE